MNDFLNVLQSLQVSRELGKPVLHLVSIDLPAKPHAGTWVLGVAEGKKGTWRFISADDELCLTCTSQGETTKTAQGIKC